MTKSMKAAKTQQVPSRLSDPEVDAALQLIQLSGEDSDDNNRSSRSSNKTTENDHHQDQEICSGMAIDDNNLDDHAFPPRKRKFRSLLEIYSKTSSVLFSNKRGAAPAATGKKIKNRRRDLMAG